MDFMYLVVVSFMLILSVHQWLRYFSPKQKKHTGFKTYPIVASLPEFLKNRDRLLEWFTEVLSESPTNTEYYRRSAFVQSIETANPLNVEHILRTNFENYPKGERFITILNDFFGHGILTSDNEKWHTQRKTVSHEFNTKSLRSFVVQNVVVETETRLVPILENAAVTGRSLDLQDVLERFAFDNICKLVFDFDPGCLGGDEKIGSEFMTAFEDATMLSAGRFWYALRSFWKIKRFFNVGSERRLREAINTVHNLADEIIRSRIESKTDTSSREDLLSRLIGNGKNSPEFLRDILTGFILAGSDTTSSALTWFFWLLSFRPDIKQKILNELKELRAQNGKNPSDPFSFEELRDLHYLHAAISESMRLYPPVPINTKQCLKDDTLPDGTFVGKDWFVTYHLYAMGRMESIWGERCLEFLPERWIGEEGYFRQESPFRYVVFHGGPRMCLGKDMAYIQMKSIAATFLERFEFEVVNRERPEYLLSLTLRMKGGLPIRVWKKDV